MDTSLSTTPPPIPPIQAQNLISRTHSFTLTWTIEKVATICKTYVGRQFHKSAIFSPFAHLPRSPFRDAKFSLLLYPHGKREEVKDFLSIEIQHVETSGLDKVYMSSKFSVITGAKEKRNKKRTNFTHVTKGSFRGFNNWIRRADVLDPAKGYLTGPDLVIQFDGDILTELVGDSPNSDSPTEEELLSQAREKWIRDLRTAWKSSEPVQNISLKLSGKGEAHIAKQILVARSPVFAAMFRHDLQETQESSIQLPEIAPEVGHELVRYLNTGTVQDLDKHAERLLPLADKYELPILRSLCELSLYRTVQPENSIRIHRLAELYKIEKLIDKAKQISQKRIAEQVEQLIESPENSERFEKFMASLSKKPRRSRR